MDGHRFDALTKTLVGTRSRRQFAKAQVAGALGVTAGVLGRRGASAACGLVGQTCAANADCCAGGRCNAQSQCACRAGFTACPVAGGERCFDLQTNRNHCGDCATACAAGQTCCGGECVNTQNDRANCGACGRTCEGSTTCCGGRCIGVCLFPPRDLKFDSSTCRYFCQSPGGPVREACKCTCPACANFDPETCRCPCADGRPRCGTVCCPTGRTCCGNQCVDLQTNETHCGSCDRACPSGKFCENGLCNEENDGLLEIGDECDPERPELCRSRKCGCSASSCNCRTSSCRQPGEPCGIIHGNLSCCEGLCRDGTCFV